MTEEDKKPDDEVPTHIGLHSVRNLLGSAEQLSLFGEKRGEIEQRGFRLDGIDRFGIELSEMQFRIMEGVLNKFTKTKYKGNLPPRQIEDLDMERWKNEEAYRNLIEIPRIKATQQEILEWAGFKARALGAGAKERAVQALHQLGNARFCFYYDRLSYNANGKPEKDGRGRWKKEEVVAVDTLFVIKEVKNPGATRLSYYEIEPSSLFLDQRENFYILIPQGWREEVQKLSHRKRVSAYVFRFLLFLRYQYELKRRSNYESPPYEIQKTPEEVGHALKIPPKTIKQHPKKVKDILQEAYEIAKRVGYLTDFERKDLVDVLYLNEEKYGNPYSSSQSAIEVKKAAESARFNETERKQANELFDYIYQELGRRVPGVQTPKAVQKNKQVFVLLELLENRKLEDVKRLVAWGFDQKYWCTKLSTPQKLKENFGEAWMEMNATLKLDPASKHEANRELAKQILDALVTKRSPVKVDMLNKYIEVGDGVHQPDIVEYEDKHFKSKLMAALRKRDAVIDEELLV